MYNVDLEIKMDKELKIETTGRDENRADDYHHPYEPTPYAVLERLAQSGYISKNNILVDYGCGKGRVDFYFSAKVGCRTIGVDFDERMIRKAEENRRSFAGKKRPDFLCMPAEKYDVEVSDCFYFFNPFSLEVLKAVLGKIIESYYIYPRDIKLFFYYPDKKYVAYLMTKNELMFVDEIDCRDLFDGENERERILIFEL